MIDISEARRTFSDLVLLLTTMVGAGVAVIATVEVDCSVMAYVSMNDAVIIRRYTQARGRSAG